jgi:hypothetical protein
LETIEADGKHKESQTTSTGTMWSLYSSLLSLSYLFVLNTLSSNTSYVISASVHIGFIVQHHEKQQQQHQQQQQQQQQHCIGRFSNSPGYLSCQQSLSVQSSSGTQLSLMKMIATMSRASTTTSCFPPQQDRGCVNRLHRPNDMICHSIRQQRRCCTGWGFVNRYNDIVLFKYPTLSLSSMLRMSTSSSNNNIDTAIKTTNATSFIDFGSLLDMDIVVYEEFEKNDASTISTLSSSTTSERNTIRKLGAVQEDGTIAPISTWSSEPVFQTYMEFLVDEKDRFPGLTLSDISSIEVFTQSYISYGSRQVGGGKGPGNPHGEESELLYHISIDAIPSDVDIIIKPELEITW